MTAPQTRISLAADGLDRGAEALSRAFSEIDRAAGALTDLEHQAALELRAQVGDALRRLKALRLFVRDDL